MKMLLANLGFGLLWIALTGRVTALDFFAGLVVGYLVLHVTQPPRRRSAYFRKVPEAIKFLLFFIREIVVSSLRVAYDVLTPRLYMRPAIIAVPLDAKTDAEITLLGCLLSLTPGTLTLDVSRDKEVLFVHAMYVRDYDRAKTAIKKGFESRILGLMR